MAIEWVTPRPVLVLDYDTGTFVFTDSIAFIAPCESYTNNGIVYTEATLFQDKGTGSLVHMKDGKVINTPTSPSDLHERLFELE